MIATGEDFHPRLSLGQEQLAQGVPIAAAVLGVLILGEVFKALEDIYRGEATSSQTVTTAAKTSKLTRAELRRLLPYIARSAGIGTVVGALPGVGSTLAATMGYAAGKTPPRRQQQHPTTRLRRRRTRRHSRHRSRQ